MPKHFYHHIIETDSVVVKLHELGLSDEETTHLIALMESNLHHTILDAILSELTSEDKELFLEHLASDDHNAIWKFLTSRIDGIEEKIQKVATELKKELHSDIDEVK